MTNRIPYSLAVSLRQDRHELRTTVSRIAGNLLPVAVSNNNFFINDIPADLHISTHPQLVTSILSGLVQSVASAVKNSCIRISAKAYNHIIVVQVKDYSTSIHSYTENELKQLQPLAEKLGGIVSMTSRRQNATTFAFSFPNFNMAASA